MRKTILSAFFIGILLTACENKSDKQKGTEIENRTDTNINSESGKDQRNDTTKRPGALEYLYKGDNGEIVDIAFFEENYEQYVEVKRDGRAALVLEQKSSTETRAVYEKDIYKFISQNGQATFTNGINFLRLTLISPLKYTFTNGEEDITITYFSKDDKRFVTISRDDKPELTLEQTTAWAKGAEYGKGPVKWHSQRNTGTLIEDGIETEYKEK